MFASNYLYCRLNKKIKKTIINMDYIKLFQTHQEYESFVSGGTIMRPNVSHCVNENDVHYNAFPIMTVKYNVTDARIPTQLYAYLTEHSIIGANMFDKVEIDGVEVSIADLDTSQGTYQFATSGEHTVKYTLKDPTLIGAEFDEQMQDVTRLGAMFYQCPNVVSVDMPNSVTSIGVYAFSNCSSLTSITIPNDVTSIGKGAFFNCSSLSSVTIPDSVTSFGNGAFQSCSNLTSVTIGNGVTIISTEAFYDCSSLTSIIIPSSVTRIMPRAFQGCSSLSSVTILNSATTIGDYAFCYCNLDAASQETIIAINHNATDC